MLDPIAQWTGLDPGWVMGILVVAGFLLLRWGWRNPFGFLRVSVVVALLAVAAYAAFELTKTGSAGRKSLMSQED